MITKENLKDLLQILGFKPASQSQPHILVKNFKPPAPNKKLA